MDLLRCLPALAIVAAAGCSDPGGTPTVDAFAGSPCDLPPGGDLRLQHYRLESADGKTRVILVREGVQQGVGHSTIFELRRLSVLQEGSCHHSAEAAALSYVNSHHNWRDVAQASISGKTYKVELTFDLTVGSSGWKVTLSVDGGAALPLRMTAGPLGCRSNCLTSPPILINELMPHNTTSWTDPEGGKPAWIELWNPSAADVNLDGYFLSDDPADRRKWALPAGTVLKRHAYLMLSADGDSAAGPHHTSFKLSPAGGWLMLVDPEGISDGERRYGPLPADRSWIHDWSAARWVESSAPTPAADNPTLP